MRRFANGSLTKLKKRARGASTITRSMNSSFKKRFLGTVIVKAITFSVARRTFGLRWAPRGHLSRNIAECVVA